MSLDVCACASKRAHAYVYVCDVCVRESAYVYEHMFLCGVCA